MANPEHLAILKKGVEAWNEWRKQNPRVTPILPEADLRGINLNGINLSRAILRKADLSCAVSSVTTSRHNEITTEVNLTPTNLVKADLHRADLYWANLDRADLSHANLDGANLLGAKLVGARLGQANLSGVNFRYAQLVKADLSRAIMTGATLYGTARDDWVIEGIECDYVFLDEHGKIRSPKGRDLARGEFERLYRALPTIEYIFENGMSPLDPVIMNRVVEAVREQNPEYDIKIDSISARGLAPSIKFTVQQEEYKEPALQMVVLGYESRLKRIEAEKDWLYDLLGRAIDKTGTRLIEAGPGAVVAMDNATINIEQHIHQAVELQKIIGEQPEDSPTFAKVAKKTALDLIGSALKDVAKGQAKEAAKQIYELGKDLGPVVVNTAAYAFFKSLVC